MMAGTHPDELNLLSYVEGELRVTERDSVAAHVRECTECSSRVRELETARDVLRAAPPLEFPAHRAALDLPARTDKRRVHVSPMRFVTVLAPIAVVIALVVASGLPTGDDAENGSSRDAGGARATAPTNAPSGAAEGEEATTLASDERGGPDDADRLVARVEGPPRRVARVLRQRGYEAFLLNGTVVVRDAKAAQVKRALADERRGRVEVALD
jgi:anti-sigma factor RsiW